MITSTIYFYMKYRYLDSNGAIFSEVLAVLGITKFAGTKRIIKPRRISSYVLSA